MNRNKVELHGHLGNDPEIKITESGRKLARLSVATNESFLNSKGEKITDTQWHTVVAWGKYADFSQGLKKGSEVQVEGKLQYGQYTDKDGIKRNTSEILVSSLSTPDKPSPLSP
jgi:single-strand DNA-binding protein